MKTVEMTIRLKDDVSREKIEDGMEFFSKMMGSLRYNNHKNKVMLRFVIEPTNLKRNA